MFGVSYSQMLYIYDTNKTLPSRTISRFKQVMKFDIIDNLLIIKINERRTEILS